MFLIFSLKQTVFTQKLGQGRAWNRTGVSLLLLEAVPLLHTVLFPAPLMLRTQESAPLNVGVGSHPCNCEVQEDRKPVILSIQSETSHFYLPLRSPFIFTLASRLFEICFYLILSFSAPTSKAHLCKHGNTLSLFLYKLLFPNGHLSDLVTKPLDLFVFHTFLCIRSMNLNYSFWMVCSLHFLAADRTNLPVSQRSNQKFSSSWDKRKSSKLI